MFLSQDIDFCVFGELANLKINEVIIDVTAY